MQPPVMQEPGQEPLIVEVLPQERDSVRREENVVASSDDEAAAEVICCDSGGRALHIAVGSGIQEKAMPAAGV